MTTAHDIDLHQFLTDRLTDGTPACCAGVTTAGYIVRGDPEVPTFRRPIIRRRQAVSTRSARNASCRHP